MAWLNIRQSAPPSTVPAWTPNPMIRRVYRSMTTRTQWVRKVADSHLFPFVHMVWGGGLLAQWGVKDFAGGIVVHNIAGMAALASVLYVGRRRIVEAGLHSIPMVALGTGLLWFGWYGFNAGSEMRVDSVTGTAFLNTDV